MINLKDDISKLTKTKLGIDNPQEYYMIIQEMEMLRNYLETFLIAFCKHDLNYMVFKETNLTINKEHQIFIMIEIQDKIKIAGRNKIYRYYIDTNLNIQLKFNTIRYVDYSNNIDYIDMCRDIQRWINIYKKYILKQMTISMRVSNKLLLDNKNKEI